MPRKKGASLTRKNFVWRDGVRTMKTRMMVSPLLLIGWAGTIWADTYNWNVGSGRWDTSSANWAGAGATWVDSTGNDAVFTNTSAATRIAIDGTRTAGIVRTGNNTAKAYFVFTNGTLMATSFRVSGSGDRSAGSSTPTFLSNVTVNTTGNIAAGRWTLVIGGSSVVTAAGMIGGSLDSVDGTWGTLTIRDNAVVTAVGGVNANNQYWILNLNGGTLVTKSILASDCTRYGGGQIIFNGTVVKPTQDTDNFLTVMGNVSDGFSSSALVGNGGAVVDTDGKNIGIKVNLKQSGSGGLTKLGAGMLTISGTNTYIGATSVSNGTLTACAKALPVATTLSVEEGATADLSGTSHTIYGLAGKGVVSNGALTVTGLIQPGGTNALGTLTAPDGLALTGKLLVDVDADNTNDVLAVQGSVNLSSATFATASTATLNSNRVYTVLTCTGMPPHFASATLPSGWTLRYTAGAVRLTAISAVTYSWNTDSGMWDTSSANWLGAGTTWVDNGDAYFTNTPALATVTIDGERTADAVRIGSGTNFAKYTFTGGTLNLSSFRVWGWGDRLTGITTPTMFSNVTVNASGNISVGRWTLAMGGSSVIHVSGIIGGTTAEGSGVWGTLVIQDSAVVTADGGVNAGDWHWLLYLNGGTLITKSIAASDDTKYDSAQLNFNGTVIKPTQSTNDFITLQGGISEGYSSSTRVGDGGAIFDTDGKNIGVGVGLKAYGNGGLTKLGAGTLTLTATNHTYAGATVVGGGCLAVSNDNAAASAVLIANASFETYDAPALVPDGTANAYRTAPTGASWIFTGGAGIATSNSAFMTAGPLSDGACAAMLYGPSTLSQTVTVSVAGLYDLRFMVAKGCTYSFNGLAAKLDGTTVVSYSTSYLADNAFRISETRNVYLSAGTHVLQFATADAAPTYATVIDLVTLTPASGGSLPSGTAVSLTASGATYAQNRSAQMIGSLSGVAGSSVVNSGVLTVGGNNTNATFAGVLSGPGSVVKVGSGTWTLGGANTYTGATSVAAGTLEITASDTLSTNTTLEVSTGGGVKLSNADEQCVSALTFDGEPKYRGTWGGPGSGARFIRAQFTGSGVLHVLNGAACPGTLIGVK